jgi:hypothetical protein
MVVAGTRQLLSKGGFSLIVVTLIWIGAALAASPSVTARQLLASLFGYDFLTDPHSCQD